VRLPTAHQRKVNNIFPFNSFVLNSFNFLFVVYFTKLLAKRWKMSSNLSKDSWILWNHKQSRLLLFIIQYFVFGSVVYVVVVVVVHMCVISLFSTWNKIHCQMFCYKKILTLQFWGIKTFFQELLRKKFFSWKIINSA